MSNEQRKSGKAMGHIAVKTYDAKPYNEVPDGPTLNEIQVTETFSGDIEGDGAVRFLQAARKDGSASFCGIERVLGTLAGRKGSFLLQDEGTLQANTVSGKWFVIPGSGTGELRGLRGEGTFTAQLGAHASWTLDWRLEG